MFTGLIRDVGAVRGIEKSGDWRVEISCALDVAPIEIGASVACSGCCLTVVEKGADWMAFEVSAESLSKTVIGNWDVGTRVNLETSLRMGDELGGHFVFGHVDGLARLVSVEREGDSHRLMVQPPAELMGFIASKGSIALDGVSLTVNEVLDDQFGVNIIAHTWEHTSLADRAVGDDLNIEIDMLARYVQRSLAYSG